MSNKVDIPTGVVGLALTLLAAICRLLVFFPLAYETKIVIAVIFWALLVSGGIVSAVAIFSGKSSSKVAGAVGMGITILFITLHIVMIATR